MANIGQHFHIPEVRVQWKGRSSVAGSHDLCGSSASRLRRTSENPDVGSASSHLGKLLSNRKVKALEKYGTLFSLFPPPPPTLFLLTNCCFFPLPSSSLFGLISVPRAFFYSFILPVSLSSVALYQCRSTSLPFSTSHYSSAQPPSRHFFRHFVALFFIIL